MRVRKMAIAVDLIDLLGQELSVRVVGRDVYMRGARSAYPNDGSIIPVT